MSVELIEYLATLSPVLPNVVVDPWGTVGTDGQATRKDWKHVLGFAMNMASFLFLPKGLMGQIDVPLSQ